jgi:hypothetical protein
MPLKLLMTIFLGLFITIILKPFTIVWKEDKIALNVVLITGNNVEIDKAR